MEDLDPESRLTNVTVAFAWLATGYTCYLLNREWLAFLHFRVVWLREGDPDAEAGLQAAYTLRV